MPRAVPVIKTLSAFDIRKSSCVSSLVFYGLFASHRTNLLGAGVVWAAGTEEARILDFNVATAAAVYCDGGT